MSEFAKKEINRVKRIPNRGVYDKKQVYEIIDSHFICHVSYLYESTALNIPTGYGRKGDDIYLHGAFKNRMLLSLIDADQVSLTITHLDGFVMARSLFHHSFNYRSVLVFGKASLVEGEDNKMKALQIITENMLPGRWSEARIPNEKELKITTVIKISIEDASAKTRTGPPADDEEDYELDIWAGILPLQVVPGPPVPDEALRKPLPVAPSATNYQWDK